MEEPAQADAPSDPEPVPQAKLPREHEAAFRAHYSVQSARRVQYGFGLGILFFMAFAAWDVASFPPELWNITLPLRLGVVLPLLMVGFIASFLEDTREELPPYVMPGAIALSLSVVAITVMGRAAGVEVSEQGLYLSILATWSLTGLRTRPAAAIACSVFATFVAGEIFRGATPGVLIEETAFLAAANLMGAVDATTREQAARVNFAQSMKLLEMAARDGLTGLANRRSLDAHLTRMIRQARRDSANLAVVLIDIDHFKQYNDQLGHGAGDDCLRKFGALLAGVLKRPLDLAARYGGEEFALVAWNVEPGGAEALSRRVHDGLAELAIPHPASPVDEYVTASVGVAFGKIPAQSDAASLLARADEALYRAKDSGRNRTVTLPLDSDAQTASWNDAAA